jgi:hypothetical protein
MWMRFVIPDRRVANFGPLSPLRSNSASKLSRRSRRSHLPVFIGLDYRAVLPCKSAIAAML